MTRSANFGPTASKTKSSTLRSEAKTILNSSTLENIEIEYIKNLQQQVYFLEMECNYFRQQMNLNGLQTSLKYDNKSQELKNEMLTIQFEKENLEKSLTEENRRNETVLSVLEQTENSYYKERDLLLKEIAALKRGKLEAEERFLNKSAELSIIKENLNQHHQDAHDSNHHLSKIEIQQDKLIKDNLHLRNELNDARHQLIARDNQIKDLHHQLADPSFRKATVNELKSSFTNVSTKLNMTSDSLLRETLSNKQSKEESARLQNEVDHLKHKIDDLSRENSRLSSTLEKSLKQNEADLIMAKKNVDLSKHNYGKIENELLNERTLNSNLKTQIDQFKLQERLESKNHQVLKTRIKDLEEALARHEETKEHSLKSLQDQLRSSQQEQTKWSNTHTSLSMTNKNHETKINELNDSIDKQSLNYAANLDKLKLNVNQVQGRLDEATMNLELERNNARNAVLKIENLERQELIQTNLIDSLKSRIHELEKQDSTNLNELRITKSRLAELEEDNRILKSEIENLNIKIKEIDRLKHLEDLIQSQKWNELTHLADSVKTLSHSMAASNLRDSNNF